MSVVDVTQGVTYDNLSDAISGSNANDVIQISAGNYVENFPNITHNLTIQAVGGMAFLSNPQPTPVNGRAVLNVPGNQDVNLTVFGLAISGAVDANNNGTGILFESGNGNLNVSNCWFYDNQDGLLIGGTTTADPGGQNVVITDSEFNNNGVSPSNPNYGFDHNLYVGGDATSVVITDSYFHDALGGDEIKSEALSTVIEDNRIQDGPTAASNYSVDLPYGGADTIVGNVIQKGPNAINEYMVQFGAQGSVAGSTLDISDNTLIDDRDDPTILLNSSQGSTEHTIPANIENNALYDFIGTLVTDTYAPPNDNISGNTYEPGPDPTLDTAPPFTIACFAAGTRIETARGPVAVEDLREDDRVLTALGSLEEIRWIGHRRLDCRRHPRPWDMLPVRVRAGAFGRGQPCRDVLLSPDHAVLAEDVLIPVRYLLNGATITQERVKHVSYYHVELQAHHILFAEGLACESYLDTGNRAAFENGGDAIQLHADFATGTLAGSRCAPLVLGGKRVARAKARLLALAARLGHARSDDPVLQLIADGEAVTPRREGKLVAAVLPPGTRSVRLVSRCFVPAHMRPKEDDTRALGVAVSRLWFGGRQVSLDSPGLTGGWHPPEPGWRWTDGVGLLEIDGITQICFEIAMTGSYWLDAPAAKPARRTRPRAARAKM